MTEDMRPFTVFSVREPFLKVRRTSRGAEFNKLRFECFL